MNLLGQLRAACACALDSILDILPVEVPAEITIIVSHPGTVEDAIVVGTHDLSQIVGIAIRCEMGATEAGTVQGGNYSTKSVTTGSALQ